MTTRQRINMLGHDTWSRLQGWRKRGSICSSKWHNGHEVLVKAVRAGWYEMRVDNKVIGIAKGRENARILVTRHVDLSVKADEAVKALQAMEQQQWH